MTVLVPNTDEEKQVVVKARRSYWTGSFLPEALFLVVAIPGIGVLSYGWLGALITTVIGISLFALSFKVDGPSARANWALMEYRELAAGEEALQMKDDRKRVKWFLRKCKDLDARKLRQAVNVVGYAYDIGAEPHAGQLIIDPKHLLDEEVRLIADFIDEVFDLEDAVSNGRASARLGEVGEQEIDRRLQKLVLDLSAYVFRAQVEADDAIQEALKDLK